MRAGKRPAAAGPVEAQIEDTCRAAATRPGLDPPDLLLGLIEHPTAIRKGATPPTAGLHPVAEHNAHRVEAAAPHELRRRLYPLADSPADIDGVDVPPAHRQPPARGKPTRKPGRGASPRRTRARRSRDLRPAGAGVEVRTRRTRSCVRQHYRTNVRTSQE